MAHKKGLGSSRNGRDSAAKRLGVKVFAGQTVTGGEIIVRQRGTRFRPGDGAGIGKDDTIYARTAGTVEFKRGRRGRVISVVSDSAGRGESLQASGEDLGPRRQAVQLLRIAPGHRRSGYQGVPRRSAPPSWRPLYGDFINAIFIFVTTAAAVFFPRSGTTQA